MQNPETGSNHEMKLTIPNSVTCPATQVNLGVFTISVSEFEIDSSFSSMFSSIQALVEFEDGCKYFYLLRAYFLAAVLTELIHTSENESIRQKAAYNLGEIDEGNPDAIAQVRRYQIVDMQVRDFSGRRTLRIN